MSFKDAVSQDYKVFDDPQTVVYVAPREFDTEVYTVTFATAEDYSAQEVIASQGFLNSSDKKWNLGRNQFPEGFKPQAGDKITDENEIDFYVSGKLITLDALRIGWQVHTTEGQGQVQ
ncbi:MAG: hypothetical protein RLZZ373_1735 [Pseudomonadota bacterium]|jgi:hypothetical protein